MKITRSGYYTITGPDGELLTKPDGSVRQVTSRDEAYERITEDGRTGRFTMHCPERYVDMYLSQSSTGILLNPTPASESSVDYPWGFNVDEDGTGASVITGGRGLDPIYVKNLNNSGTDSYASAAEGVTGGHILFENGGIVTDTSGTIFIEDGNKTIWGNTAPGGHFNLHGKGAKHTIRGNADNIIMMHIAIRLTDDPEPSSLDCLQVLDTSAVAGRPENILIAFCSFAFSSDESLSVTSDSINRTLGGTANVTLYKNLLAWPIRDAGRTADPHNKHGLFAYRDRIALIENVFAHGEGRPLIRPASQFSMLNNYYYMWSSRGPRISESNLPAPVEGWMRIEGNYFLGGSAGVDAYDATSKDPAYETTTPNIPVFASSSASTDFHIFHNDSNTGTDFINSPAIFHSSTDTYIESTDAGFDKPNGYDSRLLNAGQLDNNWLDGIGANPTTRDAVDADAITSIKDNTGIYIDDVSDIPSGGWDTSLPSVTHVTENNFGGQTLQQHLEGQSWWSDRHNPSPGFTNRTRLEAYLDTFVSGVPT